MNAFKAQSVILWFEADGHNSSYCIVKIKQILVVFLSESLPRNLKNWENKTSICACMIYVPLKENTVSCAFCPSVALEPYKGTDVLCEEVLMPGKRQIAIFCSN